MASKSGGGGGGGTAPSSSLSAGASISGGGTVSTSDSSLGSMQSASANQQSMKELLQQFEDERNVSERQDCYARCTYATACYRLPRLAPSGPVCHRSQLMLCCCCAVVMMCSVQTC